MNIQLMDLHNKKKKSNNNVEENEELDSKKDADKTIKDNTGNEGASFLFAQGAFNTFGNCTQQPQQ